jgi:hypothetical protein
MERKCECGHPWFPWHGKWEDDDRVLCLCKTCSCNSSNLLAGDKVRSQEDVSQHGQVGSSEHSRHRKMS